MEGISFLILLFIAMPFKYLLDEPILVKYVGWAHGLLFILYNFQLLYLKIEIKWSFKRAFVYFMASLIPFAPFWVDQKLKKEYALS